MFIVADGPREHLTCPGEASRRISLKDIATGEYFGELALFDDKPRSASALATTDAMLLELDRETLSRYLAQRPHAAMTLLRTMAERLRETNAMLSQRAAKNVVEEIESKLTWSQKLADKVAELNGSWAFILVLLGLTLGWMVAQRAVARRARSIRTRIVFFNLLLAILVALQGPLIVMSQNRQSLEGSRAGRDRLQGQPQERGQHRDHPARARRDARRDEPAVCRARASSRCGRLQARREVTSVIVLYGRRLRFLPPLSN